MEHQRDHGKALDGLRADGFQAGRSVQLGFNGQRDQLLDFLRREPRRLGLNDHLRRRKLREDVQPRPRRDVEAVGDDNRPERDDHPAMTQGKLDNAVQHEPSFNRPP